MAKSVLNANIDSNLKDYIMKCAASETPPRSNSAMTEVLLLKGKEVYEKEKLQQKIAKKKSK